MARKNREVTEAPAAPPVEPSEPREPEALAPPLEPAEPPKRRGRPPGSKNSPKEEGPDLRSVEAGWQGLWIVLTFVLGFFGFESDCRVLPAEEARQDAKALLPVVERFPVASRVLGWIGAPVVIVQRIMQHFKPKAPKAPKAKESSDTPRTIATPAA